MRCKWVNFLHIYQPPWQSRATLQRIVNESYEFLIRTFQAYPKFKATLNISGVLAESLAENGYQALLNDIRDLCASGQLELTGSSHVHAFLPQLPETEILRQIELHEQALAQHLHVHDKPKGFFLPEMAYSAAVGSIVHRMGYQWIILDPISTRDAVEPTRKYLDRKTGLAVVFRNREFSKAYPPEELYKLIERNEQQTVITATDGELYGHFHTDWQEHLKRILDSGEIQTLTVSEYLAMLRETAPVYLRSASWETRERSIKTNNPFSIWFNKSNPIHKQLWTLAHFAIRALAQHGSDSNFAWARKHLDRGLASCSFWWASEIKTSPFAPIAWNPDEVENGARELIKSIRSLHSLPAAEKTKAEKMYFDLLTTLWQKHWKKYGAHP